MSWKKIEGQLCGQFKIILQQFVDMGDSLSPESQTDFLGLMHYICKSRKSFKEVATQLGLHSLDEAKEKEHACTVSIDDMMDALLVKEKDTNCSSSIRNYRPVESFSREFSFFPCILADCAKMDSAQLAALCVTYWACEYPSVKESFIFPVVAKCPFLVAENSELAALIRSRLLQAQFDPFDESIALLDILQVEPFEFVDEKLSMLQHVMGENQIEARNEIINALQQSGCHCD
jgi:hypothetical protein